MGKEDYICDKLIELMETKPYYKIKVTQLVEHACISRSTFYFHFDSIYSVLQKIEDDFFDGFPDENIVGTEIDEARLLKVFSYIKDNMRIFRVLLGPNGDPSFEARLANRSRRIMRRIVTTVDVKPTQLEQDVIHEFILGGRIKVIKWWAAHENEVSVNEIALMLRELAVFNFGFIYNKSR